MSAIFVALSGLLLEFSFVNIEQKVLQNLLSLVKGLLIFYQFSHLILFEKVLLTFSKDKYLLFYRADCLR